LKGGVAQPAHEPRVRRISRRCARVAVSASVVSGERLDEASGAAEDRDWCSVVQGSLAPVRQCAGGEGDRSTTEVVEIERN
jgi:hypothetical protein